MNKCEGCGIKFKGMSRHQKFCKDCTAEIIINKNKKEDANGRKKASL